MLDNDDAAVDLSIFLFENFVSKLFDPRIHKVLFFPKQRLISPNFLLPLESRECFGSNSIQKLNYK